MNAQIDDRSVIGIDLHRRRSVVVRLVADGQQTGRATRFTDDVPHQAGSPGRPASRQYIGGADGLPPGRLRRQRLCGRCALGHPRAYGAPSLPWVAATVRALRRRVLDLVCRRCLSDRAVEEARQAGGDARRAARRIPREQGGPHR
jgi:hypothetical protein